MDHDPRNVWRLRLAAGGALAIVAVVAVWAMASSDPGPTAIGSPTASPSGPLESPSPGSTGTPGAATPTASARPSRSSLPTQSPALPSPTPLERQPLILPPEVADVGSRAVVVAGQLHVRQLAGLDQQVIWELSSGSQLLIRDGPVASDGLDWYEVLYPPCSGDCDANRPGDGWVAVGPSGQAPTLVRIDAPRCPPLLPSAGLLAAMGGLARVQCFGSDPLDFRAVIDLCYEGPIQPWVYEPAWMEFSCYFAFDPGSPGYLPIYFGPGSPDPSGLTRGTVVRVVGHLNDAAAQDCSITDGPATPTPAQQAVFRLYCRGSFVVVGLEIIGSIDLPRGFD